MILIQDNQQQPVSVCVCVTVYIDNSGICLYVDMCVCVYINFCA